MKPDGYRQLLERLNDLTGHTPGAIELIIPRAADTQQIADLLGITRKSLWEKRKKWSLNRK